MRFFTSPTVVPANSEDRGPAVLLKPSRWKRLFRKRGHQRSPSLSSALSESFGELESVSSVENFRIIGHVEEINFRDRSPESQVSSDACSVCSREGDLESLNQVIKRELFSDRTIFLDGLDGQEEMPRIDTMKSVYGNALDGEENFEVKETMKIDVVAEVNEGIVSYIVTNLDLPTIAEDEGDSSFMSISPDEFVPPSQTARKFILITFIVLLTTAKSERPMTINSRW